MPTRPAAFAAPALAAVALTSLGPPACDDVADAPGARRVTLQTRAEPEGVGGLPGAAGWSVTLTRARVSLGALYYFDGEPVLARAAPPAAPGDRPGWPFGVRAARAHPGHYLPGNALGQMVQPASVDLVVGAAALPAGDGVTGPFRSAKLVFAAPADGSAPVALEGRAERGAEARAFRAEFSLDELRADATEAEAAVVGCAFDPADVRGDGTVTVVVRPAVWFEQVDFAGLAPAEGGAPAPLGEGGARRALARGLKKGAAYGFHFSP